jgi:hypothetical protein
LKTGQYIRFPVTSESDGSIVAAPSGSRIYGKRGRAHNDLFVTIANAMGVHISEFGNTSIAESKGIVSEMLA